MYQIFCCLAGIFLFHINIFCLMSHELSARVGVITSLKSNKPRKHILENDAQAYHYCLLHKNAYIAIVWPIAQGRSKEIERIFKQCGKLLYYKKYVFNFDQAYNLLQKAHPDIPDMVEHVNWYFPEEIFLKPARIFVLEFDSFETAFACKMSIRHIYDLQYRSIHINDTHEETVQLARFFLT